MSQTATIVKDKDERGVPSVSPHIYSLADFKEVVGMIHAASGISLSDQKRMLVYSRLAPLVRESRNETFASFLEGARANRVRLERMVSALTTNHTFFNREAYHFDHFAASVRPELVKRLTDGGSVRMWSAGCSTGEEAWSLLLSFLGTEKTVGTKLLGSDFKILATDIATDVLRSAAIGRYPEDALSQLPEGQRKAWCAMKDGFGTIDPEARAAVRFLPLNLVGEWPISVRFDVVMCRNVAIYFDRPEREALFERIADQTAPGGYLYIGHSEQLTGASSLLFEQVQPTIFRKKAA